MVIVKQIKQHRKIGANPISPSLTITKKSRIEVSKSLERYYKYIVELARTQVPRRNMPPEEFTEEVNDLTQTTLITFWLRLISEQVQITAPKAYIGFIVRSRCVDMIRRRQRESTLPLPVDQDGELYQGRVLLIPSDGMRDPALEFERKELIAEVVDDILILPPIQQYAIICSLKDEVGDTFPLTEIFRKHGIDIESINWPQERIELQKLQSSLSVARKKLRSFKGKYGLV